MTHLADILARQRATFLRDGAPDLAQRRADLAALRRAIASRRGQIEAAINSDFGHRSRHETALMEILPTLQGIAYLSRNLRRFMRAERRHVEWSFRFGRAHIEYQPLGVIGIVSPWNYPLSLAMMPLATALAAGNRAMIKPSEFTPHTSRLLTEMLNEIFPAEKVAVVMGDAETGKTFTALPFDHILFTGSTPVGKAVMRAASENLVPVTLELGGKSPVIVGPEIHTIEYPAVEAIAAGVCLRVETPEALTKALTDWPGPGPEAIQAFFTAHSGATKKTLAALDEMVKPA